MTGLAPPGLISCVPNFSEGRRLEVVDKLCAAVDLQTGSWLLDRHSDPDHNRSVLTIAGIPAAVSAATFAAATTAVELIDLRRHQGVHPRMGAVDVVPLVPLGDTPLEACVELAQGLGARLGAKLEIPVYLYGAAALRGHPDALNQLRGEGFESLLALGERLPTPDFGPPRLHPSAGAVAVGARPPLIAFNLILRSGGAQGARRLARRLRGTSGGLPGVQALGLWLESREAAQVSMNLLDYRTTGLAQVLDRALDEAETEGIEIDSGELVGLLPAAALKDLDRFDLAGLPGPGSTIEARLAIAQS